MKRHEDGKCAHHMHIFYLVRFSIFVTHRNSGTHLNCMFVITYIQEFTVQYRGNAVIENIQCLMQLNFISNLIAVKI